MTAFILFLKFSKKKKKLKLNAYFSPQISPTRNCMPQNDVVLSLDFFLNEIVFLPFLTRSLQLQIMRRRRASSSPPPLSISWLNLFASLSFISIYIIASQTQILLTIRAPKSLPILHNLNIFYLIILPLFLFKLSKPSVCLPHSSLFLSKLNKALSVSSRFLPSDLCLSLSQFEPIVA